MSASAWKFYNRGKHYICTGTIELNSTTFDLHLFQSSSNFATKTLSTLGSLTNQVSSANNYTTAGKSLTSVTWTAGASAGQQEFTSAALTFTATGGTIANIKAACVIARTGASAKAPANKIMLFASLTSSQFTISQNNTLTVTMNTSGIFTLT